MIMNRVRILIIILSSVIFLGGCAGTRNFDMRYESPKDYQNLFSSVSPLKIKVLNFLDKREGNREGIWIGHRTAAFNVSMGEVYSERPIFDIVQEAIQSELKQGGHSIVAEGQDITIQGTIDKFIVYTDTTLLYWDIVGEVTLSLTVVRNDGTKSKLLGPYSGKSVKRTYVNPSIPIMRQVLQNSLSKTMKELCSDKQIIDFLNNK